ncbi:MAG TPA: S9 family peptidase [Pseudonocardiaceae bacterium]
MSNNGQITNPFADLTHFVALPRLSQLALSPDGQRLVTVVSELSPDRKTWQGALWEVDPRGERPARRLTRSAEGETAPVFTPDGAVLFTSKRKNPEASPDTKREEGTPALWLLPPVGEAREIFAPGGGVQTVRVAERSGTVLLSSQVHPGVEFGDEDDKKRKARRDAGVTAILHESYPVRFWDHDLGPARPRLLVTPAPNTDSGQLTSPTDLTPDADGRVTSDAAISPDGELVAYCYEQHVSAAYGPRTVLRVVRNDGSGDRVLVDIEGMSFHHPVFTPDGSAVVCVRCTDSTTDTPPDFTLVRVDVATGEVQDLLPDFPHHPSRPVLAADGSALYFTADCQGRCPVWRLALTGPDAGTVTRLTGEGAYSDLCVAPDGTAVYALRSAVDHPPQPVRIDPGLVEQDPVRLPAPGAISRVPGTLTEIQTQVADGRTVRAWLVLPEGASPEQPAPLLLWVHGGPLNSWNAWTWRWNPWTAAARGYAVLLPDPALSTGYGQEFIAAGWGAWGAAPYTDLMAITDTAVARPDIDGERTAAMGGSFGGYMANWIATQTDRFKAIVTHASLWHLDSFTGTTDDSYYWLREMGDPLRHPERIAANSPHLRVAEIRTPMLVIHGDRDYRVPIGEGLRLFFDLVRHDVPVKFLYYPTENHWILTPGNSRVWYETVFAFLAEHVLGQKWQRPELV